ncbi:MAG: hypothetical protein K6G80_02740 [Treponema sp.]|nr:hypothetical protein [Treponema sp.]
MSNDEAIKVLKNIKAYANRDSLDALEYTIKVLKKLECAGITDPLQADFSAVAANAKEGN